MTPEQIKLERLLDLLQEQDVILNRMILVARDLENLMRGKDETPPEVA